MKRPTRDQFPPDPDGIIEFTHPRYGLYATTTHGLDKTITEHLPASPLKLRTIIQERTGDRNSAAEVFDVGALLIILASFDHDPRG